MMLDESMSAEPPSILTVAHLISAGGRTEDGRTVHHVERGAHADVECGLGRSVPRNVLEVGCVECEDTAVLNVKVQSVGRGDRTNQRWVGGRTVVVGRDETTVLSVMTGEEVAVL